MIPTDKWIGIYTTGQFPDTNSENSIDIIASDGSILAPSIHGYKIGSLQYRGIGQDIGKDITVRFARGDKTTVSLPSTSSNQDSRHGNSDSNSGVLNLSYKWEITIISKFYVIFN